QDTHIRSSPEDPLDLDQEVDGGDGVDRRSRTAGAEKLTADNGPDATDSRNAGSVISRRGNDAGDVCSMPRIIQLVAGSRDRVKPVRPFPASDRLSAYRHCKG